MDKILIKQGYLINKNLNKDKLNQIISDLTVSPLNNYNKNVTPESFKVYIENEESLILPKFYGIKHFGLPIEDKQNEGIKVDLEFNGTLKEKQSKIISEIIPEYNKMNGGLLCLGCGEGKCLGFDTNVMMYDGKIKKVQNISIGDQLMGDNLKPRNVLSITTGTEDMYEIRDLSSCEYYVVNYSHILSLIYLSDESIIINNIKYNRGDIIDISIQDYLLNIENMINFYGYRLPITHFKSKKVSDPYEVGKNISNYKYIPDDYKINSYKDRQKLSYGIYMSNLVIFRNLDNFIIGTNNSNLLNDIIYLYRSLGHNVYKLNVNYLFIEYNQT
jgi:hypothetical protein